jgi:hypothetical protein
MASRLPEVAVRWITLPPCTTLLPPTALLVPVKAGPPAAAAVMMIRPSDVVHRCCHPASGPGKLGFEFPLHTTGSMERPQPC